VLHRADIVIIVSLVALGCGSKTQLGADAAVDAAADSAPGTDAFRPDTPAPPDTSIPPPPMTCARDDTFAFVEGGVAGERFLFDFGFSGGIRDMGKCGPDWVLVFANEPCIVGEEPPVPSVRVTVTDPRLFESGLAYTGEAIFVTEGGVAVFPVEVQAEELSDPESEGRVRGFLFSDEFELFGEFDLVMDPDLIPLPFCA